MRYVYARLGGPILTGAVLALIVALGVLLPKCEDPGPHPFTQRASVTTIHHPPSFVFWFTQVPKRLEPFDCQLVPGLSPQFQGLRVWVCVPYFLNGYPARSYRP